MKKKRCKENTTRQETTIEEPVYICSDEDMKDLTEDDFDPNVYNEKNDKDHNVAF